METESPSTKSDADGSSHSTPKLALEPAVPPPEEHPKPKIAPVAISLVTALMHDILSLLNVSTVPTPELPKAETHHGEYFRSGDGVGGSHAEYRG